MFILTAVMETSANSRSLTGPVKKDNLAESSDLSFLFASTVVLYLCSQFRFNSHLNFAIRNRSRPYSRFWLIFCWIRTYHNTDPELETPKWMGIQTTGNVGGIVVGVGLDGCHLPGQEAHEQVHLPVPRRSVHCPSPPPPLPPEFLYLPMFFSFFWYIKNHNCLFQ